MKVNFYKQLFESSPIGYAYHRIVCGNDGTPCDYEFIEVNSVFEELMCLESSLAMARNAGLNIFAGIFRHTRRDIEEDGYEYSGRIASFESRTASYQQL